MLAGKGSADERGSQQEAFQTKAALVMAGIGLTLAVPAALPMMAEAGLAVSSEVAAGLVTTANVAGGAATEYGLTGQVTPEGFALSTGLGFWQAGSTAVATKEAFLATAAQREALMTPAVPKGGSLEDYLALARSRNIAGAQKQFQFVPTEAIGMASPLAGAERAAAIYERTQEIHSMRRAWEVKNGTTAMARVRHRVSGETQLWLTMDVTTLPRELSKRLPDDVVFKAGVGHAEETLVRALGPEWEILEGASTRNICLHPGACAWLLGEQGVGLGGPGFAGNGAKTGFRWFWRE